MLYGHCEANKFARWLGRVDPTRSIYGANRGAIVSRIRPKDSAL
jgi:hypothetical protein